MVMFASQVQQQLYASQLSMSQQMQQAQMLSMQMGLMPQQPMMPRMGMMSGATPGYGGIYGEQIANRLANTGRTAVGMGGLGLGVAGALTGMPLDPFSAGLAGARVGFGAAGIGGGLAGAAIGALPFWAASQVGKVYGGAFSGGMQDQAGTNSVLRSSFNFQGGGGAFGRGFSQQQMGQVGSMISQEVGRSPFSSSQELNQLIGQGAESGMFTAVRDVESFSKRFKTMLDGLRKIQKELGGTLSEALQFTRGAQQLGIFTSGGRTAFAAEMRDTMATTGMDQNQAFSLAATGSMLSRATGGLGRQGATGALRTARQLGAAVNTGVINSELLSEATGGLQGTEAIQAFTSRTLQMSDRFSRTARGRYSLFAMANEEGNGLDEAQLARFRSGDISTGEIMRGAHTRVNKMGRARALNQEGILRGAMMEEGGMSGQIGIMRKMLGDRALDGGDDLAQLVMQRRMGLSQQESQVWTSLMRNQSQIANAEDVDKSMGRRQVEHQQDVRLNRSLESFMANLEHGLQDATGVTAAREAGKKFLTRISSAAEKAMNDFLGVSASSLTGDENKALTRLTMGMSTSKDRERLTFMGGGATGMGSAGDPFQQSTGNKLLHAMGIHTTQTYGEMMDSRGTDIRSMSVRERAAAERSRVSAQLGVVRGSDLEQLRNLQGDEGGTLRRMMMAEMGGGRAGIYKEFGGAGGASANAVDAFAHRRGYGMGDVSFMGIQGGESRMEKSLGSILAHAGQGALTGGLVGAGVGSLGVGVGAVVGGALGGLVGGIGYGLEEAMRSTEWTDQDKALGFLSRGGHAGAMAKELVEAGGGRAGNAMPAENKNMSRSEALSISRALQKDVDPQAMKSVLENDTFKTSIRRLSGLKGRAQTAELSELRIAASNMEPGQKAAAQLLITQLEHNLKTYGTVGKEAAYALNDPKKAEEARRRFAEAGGSYDALAEALPEGKLRDLFGAAANNFYDAGEGRGDQDKLFGGVGDVVNRISDMSDKELRQYSKALGSTDVGRGLLAAGTQRRNAVREMSGGGRRGQAGAADSIFGAATGNMLGEMDLTMGGRALNKRNQAQVLFREFKKGGKGADELQEQLVAQLEQSGVKDASHYINQVRSAISKDGVQSEEAKGLFDKLSKDENIQKIRSEGVLRAQTRNDPLGVQRNSLLEGILAGVNKMAGVEAPTQTLPPAQKPA
jgi:hypothetical protein